MAIHVRKPGLSTTIQDLGRYGYAHLGISPAGAADSLSFRIANLLVGNEEDAPALEMTLLGATLEFDAAAIVAITGADCEPKLGASQAPLNTAFEVPAGAVLSWGHMTDGARSYLAVQGGFDVPLIMGSASTDVRGHFGGHDGRRLQSGDVLNISSTPSSPIRTLRAASTLISLRRGAPIRVTRGAQQDWFGPEAFAVLYADGYTVSDMSDRAGLRLKGAALRPREHSQLLTDGIPLGAIQVPQDGQPIILFVDQQTTGGYPKIANIIAADMHRVGQLPPRQEVRFAEVSIPEAVRVLREQERWLKEIFQ
jgi:antagonist of KipI